MGYPRRTPLKKEKNKKTWRNHIKKEELEEKGREEGRTILCGDKGGCGDSSGGTKKETGGTSGVRATEIKKK